MESISAIGITKRTRSFWSALALLSIFFHVGLSAVHCHDLERYQGKIGQGIERYQEQQGNQETTEGDEACVICQLLSVFKGTAPHKSALAGMAFAGLIVQLFVWRTAFIPHMVRLTGRPRAPPISQL